MQKLIIEPPLLTQLGQIECQLELCDGAGHTIGYFVPLVPHDADLYAWAKDQFTDEELNRRKQEPGGRTTEQVLERLASL